MGGRDFAPAWNGLQMPRDFFLGLALGRESEARLAKTFSRRTRSDQPS